MVVMNNLNENLTNRTYVRLDEDGGGSLAAHADLSISSQEVMRSSLRCTALRSDGEPCRGRARESDGLCFSHAVPAEERAARAARARAAGVKAHQRRVDLYSKYQDDVEKGVQERFRGFVESNFGRFLETIDEAMKTLSQNNPKEAARIAQWAIEHGVGKALTRIESNITESVATMNPEERDRELSALLTRMAKPNGD